MTLARDFAACILRRGPCTGGFADIRAEQTHSLGNPRGGLAGQGGAGPTGGPQLTNTNPVTTKLLSLRNRALIAVYANNDCGPGDATRARHVNCAIALFSYCRLSD